MEKKSIEEIKNRQIINSMWIMGIAVTIFFLAFVLLACYFIPEGPALLTIIVCAMILFIAVAIYLVKMEVDAGYYECKNCSHRFVPKYTTAILSPHIHTTRYMRCPKCNKKTWCKKRMTKE